MTILVGVHDPRAQETWIATDEQSTDGEARELFRLERHEKWVESGKWVVALGGQVSTINTLFRTSPGWKNAESPLEIVDSMRGTLKASPHYLTERTRRSGMEYHAITGLIAHPHGLWALDGTLDPSLVLAGAEGGGRKTALGALWAARMLELPIMAQLQIAVDAAIAFDTRCGGQTSIVVTTNSGIRRIQ